MALPRHRLARDHRRRRLWWTDRRRHRGRRPGDRPARPARPGEVAAGSGGDPAGVPGHRRGAGPVPRRRRDRRAPARPPAVQLGRGRVRRRDSPREFLRTLDFFVYFHDPDWVEAFGRTILEAMASGVPVIVGDALPGHLRRRGALHRPGRGPRPGASSCTPTAPAYGPWSGARGRSSSERYGSASHLARLGLRSAPCRSPAPRAAPKPRGRPGRPAGAAGRRRRRTVCRAIARRLPPSTRAGGGRRLGAGSDAHGRPADRVPAGAGGLGAAALDRLRPRPPAPPGRAAPARAVVVGGLPHDGILAATDDHPDVAWLWMRPAMWPRGTGAGSGAGGARRSTASWSRASSPRPATRAGPRASAPG